MSRGRSGLSPFIRLATAERQACSGQVAGDGVVSVTAWRLVACRRAPPLVCAMRPIAAIQVLTPLLVLTISVRQATREELSTRNQTSLVSGLFRWRHVLGRFWGFAG